MVAAAAGTEACERAEEVGANVGLDDGSLAAAGTTTEVEEMVEGAWENGERPVLFGLAEDGGTLAV